MISAIQDRERHRLRDPFATEFMGGPDERAMTIIFVINILPGRLARQNVRR